MSLRNTLVRSLHDVGLAAWFGGSLMGAVGVNGSAAEAHDPSERLRLSSIGWAKWVPWQVVAVAGHAVGGLGLIAANRKRLEAQDGAKANTGVKLVLTLAAAAATAYSGYLGTVVARHTGEPTEGATDPAAGSSAELESAQKQLQLLQWTIPALTGAALVLGAQQGEQQRDTIGHLDAFGDRVAAAKN